MYSFDPAVGVGSLRLEAWGLRNPYGSGLDPFHSGMLFSTDNGADTRGVAGETGVPVKKEDLEIGDRVKFSNFIVKPGHTTAEIFDPSRLNKPIDVKCQADLMLIVDFGVFEPALGLQQAGMGKVWAVAQGNTPTAVMVSEHPIRYSYCPPQLESSDGDRPEKDFSRQISSPERG